MKFTYYGQSCFIVEVQQKKLLFDPFIKHNPLAKNINIKNIEADFLLLSHGHGDHTADAVELAKQTGAMCIANAEVADWLGSNGIKKVHPINQGGPVKFDFGTVRGVNAIHSSSFNDGTYAGNPIGFVIKTDEGNFYFAGDTSVTLDMQLIPRFAKLDFAVLPIGGNYTMDPDDAIIAADFIQCKTIIGVHYNTFDLIKIDKEKAKKDFEAAGLKLLLPDIGETIEV